MTNLLAPVVAAVEAAAVDLAQRFSPGSPIATADELIAAIRDNDARSLAILRPALERARPQANWADDEEEGGALPPGEWWVTDPVEGNVNHIHGRTGWGVSATLVRDNEPVLAVVTVTADAAIASGPYPALQQPALRIPALRTYVASIGGGAWSRAVRHGASASSGSADSAWSAGSGRSTDSAPSAGSRPSAGPAPDDVRLAVSAKTELRASLVGTGQARPGEDHSTTRLMGASVIAMLDEALLVQTTVPATLPLLEVASGQTDVFWQFSQVRSGLLAGALFVREAGGVVSDVHGNPWTVDSADFLAAAPGVAAEASTVLAAAADRLLSGAVTR